MRGTRVLLGGRLIQRNFTRTVLGVASCRGLDRRCADPQRADRGGTTLPRVFALTVLSLFSAQATADFLAYSVNDGRRSPLPERISKVDTKYLVNVEWGNYDGKRTRIGLLEIDNQSRAETFQVASGSALAGQADGLARIPTDGIEALIADTMNRTRRFRLMEREGGQVRGAQYLVQLAITKYESKPTKGIGGLVNRVPILSGVSAIAGAGRVGMNFRLIDALTGEVVYTTQVNASMNVAGPVEGDGRLAGDVALGGFYSDYSRAPVGQAVIAAINRGVYEIVQYVGAEPAEGSVIQADDLEVWINLGSDVVSVGERFEVMQKGEDLIDPDTGRSLGSTDRLIGSIQISRVQEKFSIARPVSLSATPMRGDKVISLAPPPRIEYADKFVPPVP